MPLRAWCGVPVAVTEPTDQAVEPPSRGFFSSSRTLRPAARASIAAAKALPALQGIFAASEIRVPTPVVSLADFSIVTKRNVSVEEVNEAFKKAAKEPFYQGILDATDEELVSTDFIGNSHSAIVDLHQTQVVGGNLLKVQAWYDNEWGYSNRLVEVVADSGKYLSKGEHHEHHHEEHHEG